LIICEFGKISSLRLLVQSNDIFDYRTLEQVTTGTVDTLCFFPPRKNRSVAMRDNRRVFRTIQQAIVQLYPGEPKGITARMLTTLAAMVSGIVLGKSCQLPPTASMPPTSLSGPAGLPQLAPARNPFQ
jgi:hypothetical protein